MKYAPISAYVYVDDRLGPIVSLFCVNTRGESCCINVKGFVPYFYMKLPENEKVSALKMDENMKGVISQMNKTLYLKLSKEKSMKQKNGLYFDRGKDPDTAFCKSVISERTTNEFQKDISIPKLFFIDEKCQKKCFDRYRSHPLNLLKIRTRLPSFVGEARRLLSAPLGTGRSIPQRWSRDLPWIDIRLISNIHGKRYEDAYKFAEVSDGSIKINAKRKHRRHCLCRMLRIQT